MPFRFQKNSSKTMATDAMGPVHVSDVSRQQKAAYQGLGCCFFKGNTSLCNDYFYVFSALPEGPSSAPQRSITDGRRSQELAPF